MDRPAASSPSDAHWAPDHIVLARTVLTYHGRLLVELESDGSVYEHAPLAGMAAVEQRFPAWALGPFGRVEPERRLPRDPGVFALVQAGVTRYVGASRDLYRTFGSRGLGEISRRDCQAAGKEESCRLNRLVVAEAKAGRQVDLYVLVTEGGGWFGRGAQAPEELAGRIAEAAHGSWHLPR
ncbi:hypothetical protein [Cellulomonas bogoriensis]|uniref:Uncharacterized protein n=1 Tax=Cellulomonas bogoriensis 69B4 = DSM 16987 TaxID=1386082 RepID=A0A0A0BKL9_9CELL|nr:hypothetical protein [Cellulomonas bogoriensis]KGM09073.1 hypothetical protein N869_08250 [Cellulomonas bogoriensis 69B4 = DSM 16987]